jgi:hypothetical protein
MKREHQFARNARYHSGDRLAIVFLMAQDLVHPDEYSYAERAHRAGNDVPTSDAPGIRATLSDINEVCENACFRAQKHARNWMSSDVPGRQWKFLEGWLPGPDSKASTKSL